MKKNVSAIVSGLGMAMSIFTSLTDLVRRFGGVDEDIYVLATPDGANLLEQIAKLIVEFGQKTRNAYRVVVDYSQSLSEAIKAGKYDWVNENITQENFPKNRDGQTEVKVELLHFNRVISSEDALAEMKAKGYRPATIEELLALGAKHPELQREFPVVALGSVWSNPLGYRYAPDLCRGDSGRGLFLDYLEGDWGGYYRFAVVRELS